MERIHVVLAALICTLVLLALCSVISKLQEESAFRESFYRELYAKNQELEKELQNYQSEIRQKDKQIERLAEEKTKLEEIIMG